MSNFKKSRNNVKFIIVFILISILLVSMIFVFVKLDKNEKTKTLGANSFTYSIGLLDDSGEYEQGTTSIYTKDYHSVDGMSVDINDDATISYKIFWYGEEKEFISSSSTLTSDFDSVNVLPEASYFKIMITPNNDPEVSFFEINNYASQLSVTINK